MTHTTHQPTFENIPDYLRRDYKRAWKKSQSTYLKRETINILFTAVTMIIATIVGCIALYLWMS